MERPWRKLSVRAHISLTGLPTSREIVAASNAASQNRWRPNEPPPWATWTVTLASGRPRLSAICSWPRSGTSGLTRSRPCRRGRRRPHSWAPADRPAAEVEREGLIDRRRQRDRRASAGAPPPCRSASTWASDLPSTEPGPQLTFSARIASMHWPNVWARTATPPATYCVCGMITTSVTPGIALTAARLRTARRVPLIVGGRQTIVGSAPGTSRSIANCLWPVTMSWASTRPAAYRPVDCADAA